MNTSYWELSRCSTVGLLALAILLPFTAKEGQAQNQGPAEIDFRSPGQTLRFQGQVVAKPDLVVEVVASMWGKIYLEEGIYEGAKVEKDQPLARTVLELPNQYRQAGLSLYWLSVCNIPGRSPLHLSQVVVL